jgi:hypothetical protein
MNNSETFNQAIREISQEIASLVISKQKDYGTGNILNCPLGPDAGIIVRLSDKISRLANLTQNHKNPSNESLEDTWKDIVGYGLIGLMVKRGLFKLPLEADFPEE